jgi:hypothetical protein
MEVGLKVINIQNFEKDNLVSNPAENEGVKKDRLVKELDEGSYLKSYDRIDISKKAKIAYRAREVMKNLKDIYLKDKENISKYRKIMEEGKYLLRKVSEIIAERLRDKLLEYPIKEFQRFPMPQKDYLAYKIANQILN